MLFYPVNGSCVMESKRLSPAWGSRPAYRVPRELFLKQFKFGSEELDETIARVYNKNRILNSSTNFLIMKANGYLAHCNRSLMRKN